MKLQVARRAQREADRIAAWWAANRPAAPTLFIDELEATFRRLCETPSPGVGWPTSRRPTLRRVLMPRTQNHVYFCVDEAKDVVRVLAVWGAPKGGRPKL
ncbi:MAG: type II toxin-antitoxin system RelE/ParE family toxin [Labilithrix sp.]|nr:type II toxin-antitoxin system RelE/ParE family toxin [Labilithrix sp.]MBX3217245.1 type II toxin-antitoxin system RelE/ParE family toxin [Labilithrix sp.]